MGERYGSKIFHEPHEMPAERWPTDEQESAARAQLAAFNAEVRRHDSEPDTPGPSTTSGSGGTRPMPIPCR